MAIYHFSAQMVKRSEGRSSIAMSAYRSAEKLIDEATELIKDYTSKTKVFCAEILVPKNAPEWAKNRQKLWNKVEASEKRKDAQLAREINVALPRGLPPKEMQELARKFVQEVFVSKGMIADLALHNLHGDNPHFHVMLTTRKLDGVEFGAKERAWNDKELLKNWRKQWQYYANLFLTKNRIDATIDHRSLVDQGLDRTPQIHVGVTHNAPEASIRKQRNKAIIEKNNTPKEKKAIAADIVKTNLQIELLDIGGTYDSMRDIRTGLDSTTHEDAKRVMGWVDKDIRSAEGRIASATQRHQELVAESKKLKYLNPLKIFDFLALGKEDKTLIQTAEDANNKLFVLERVKEFLTDKIAVLWEQEAPQRAEQQAKWEEERQQRKLAKEAMRARWKAQKVSLKKSYSKDRDDEGYER